MLQVTTECAHTVYDQTGASVVAIIFLSVFVVLIFGDAVLTWRALSKTLTNDEREAELNERIKTKKAYLAALEANVQSAEQNAKSLSFKHARAPHRHRTAPLPPPPPPQSTIPVVPGIPAENKSSGRSA
jgi:hypothetical protein